MEDKQIPGSFIFVVGLPGSGKSSLCLLTTLQDELKEYGYKHLSVHEHLSDLYYQNRRKKEKVPEYRVIRDFVQNDKTPPADELTSIIKRKMIADSQASKNDPIWLVEGFPLDMESALAFEEKIGKPSRVIFLDCRHALARRHFISVGQKGGWAGLQFRRRRLVFEKNWPEVLKHYESITITVRMEGDIGDCFDDFVEAVIRG
ncbi:P-loop containing nucleoside triphosphate hydrolase protein [Xylariomycetidae sp. FL2044]|nr:P-loop containing nucleoside triphosphate hydrolase protein [Xylariomycetidae sp. FL2044]